jgi:hypothetical protein
MLATRLQSTKMAIDRQGIGQHCSANVCYFVFRIWRMVDFVSLSGHGVTADNCK